MMSPTILAHLPIVRCLHTVPSVSTVAVAIQTRKICCPGTRRTTGSSWLGVVPQYAAAASHAQAAQNAESTRGLVIIFIGAVLTYVIIVGWGVGGSVARAEGWGDDGEQGFPLEVGAVAPGGHGCGDGCE